MKKYIEPTIHILVWGTGYFLLLKYTYTIVDFRKDTGPYWLALLFGMLMNQAVFYTSAYFLVPKFLRLKRIPALVFSLTAGFLFINLFESIIDYKYMAVFFSTETETFIVHFLYNSVVSFFILLVALTYALIKYWIQNEKLKRVLLEEKLSTEMAFLKSKINPHFLFNVLNSFYAKSLEYKAPELAEGIAKLAELMRYMVYETNEVKVALDKEIHHLKNYIQVYQLRISNDDKVFINFTIKGDTKDVKISPMLLIPFVENAIKHGIDPKTKSIINISIEVEKKKLYFNVKNTIQRSVFEVVDEPSGFGLDNLKKRLSVLYPNTHTLETKEEKGYFISLLILQLD